ncbi:hypothetical protein jhhlp_004081 [Lomentospora prolificans]|uniref:FAD-binding PCMH-type domain-containing protein n=1 Tax=Lomentospora prolificans TaxID=41688 RepID=A0A2N3NAI9_9PEZI|nr:hypothetical protein jhhlp_004081 [Lomentospora prolificans]
MVSTPIKPRNFFSVASQLLSLSTVVHGGRTCSPQSCKVIPGDANWPSQASWARFNESIGGGLLQPAPPGAVCHQGFRTYDPDQCPAVVSGWATYHFHAEHPTSSQWNQFSNDSCLPDPSNPCDASGYPTFVVNATETEHVQAAVNFARENNVRLIVKATGHDFLGRSIAPNSLSIWTHHMKGIEYHEGSFTPQGCYAAIETNAVTIRAGGQMADLQDFLRTKKETVVGGNSRSVGIGGYLTGGGHSILGSQHGLATDHVLEVQLVTPDGEVVVANECQNEDLFWAVRGGGGSTFGVITSATLETIPTPPLIHVTFALFTLPDAPQLHEYQAFVLSKFPSWSDAGVGAYAFVAHNISNTYFPGPPDYISGVMGLIVLPGATNETEIYSIIYPAIQEAQSKYPNTNVTVVAAPEAFDSYQSWWDKYFDNGTAGYDQYLSSRLLDERTLSDVDSVALALEEYLNPTGMGLVHLVAGKGVRDAKPRGGSSAVNPAWRDAYVHIVKGRSFEPLSEEAKNAAIEGVKADTAVMTKLAPHAGAYLNEASLFEEDWQHTFWGENYERLLEIKREIDPKNVFVCHPCVGSENWKEVNGRLCKV